MPQDAPTNALAPALAAAEENGLFVDEPGKTLSDYESLSGSPPASE